MYDIDAIDNLSDEEVSALLFSFELNTRENQRMPKGDWNIWLVLAGRGFGKTQIISQNIKKLCELYTHKRIALVAPTARDYMKTNVLGKSGLLKAFPDYRQPTYKKSDTRVELINNNIVDLYEGCNPERIRGATLDYTFLDEFASYKDPKYVLDMALMANRENDECKTIIVTTPLPLKILKDLIKDSADPENKIIVTRGTTFDNTALSDTYIKYMHRLYDNTTIGRQEILGELLDSLESNLFTTSDIEKGRLTLPQKERDLLIQSCSRIVVAVDPATTSKESSDYTGIIVAGVINVNNELHGYVLEDATMKGTPAQWASTAVRLYRKYHADRIVAEVNQGGDMVEHTIKTVDTSVSYRGVHASRGKLVRAEPVASLYEQTKIHHVNQLNRLETQMCEYNPISSDESPDRMDALVWAITDLMLDRKGMRSASFGI